MLGLLISLPAAADGRLSARGGMSGGGGNVLPGRTPEARMDPEDVEHRVKSARYAAIDYLVGFEQRYRDGTLSPEQALLAEKAFSGKKDLITVSQTVRPDIEEDSPCYDFEGKAVDGSIRAEKANRICISSHRIANKVHESEIVPQSAALMIHEYSEVMGFSEDEATALQIHVYADMVNPAH